MNFPLFEKHVDAALAQWKHLTPETALIHGIIDLNWEVDGLSGDLYMCKIFKHRPDVEAAAKKEGIMVAPDYIRSEIGRRVRTNALIKRINKTIAKMENWQEKNGY
jgi:hypothetical protein